jgi:predicted nucleotidyltransferase
MCTKNTLDSIMKRIVEFSKQEFKNNLESVILYGSYARGDYDDDSDIDVMILLNLPKDSLENYISSVTKKMSRLSLEYDVVISVVLKDIETFNHYVDTVPFYKNVEREGKRIAV